MTTLKIKSFQTYKTIADEIGLLALDVSNNETVLLTIEREFLSKFKRSHKKSKNGILHVKAFHLGETTVNNKSTNYYSYLNHY